MSYHIRVNGLPLCLAKEDGLDTPAKCCHTLKKSADKDAEVVRVNPALTVTVQKGDCPEMSKS